VVALLLALLRLGGRGRGEGVNDVHDLHVAAVPVHRGAGPDRAPRAPA
jgi:hypothetical protein